MSQLPINPLSNEEQQKILRQMYLLMDKQVKSYHAHRHMGSNSSVPLELAQELMDSVEYTCNLAGGVSGHGDLETVFHLGQEKLEGKKEKARYLLELVRATCPKWQTECRWEALRYLGQYLERYDHLHLAHQGPVGLHYPVLIAPPDGVQGIDSCLFYLGVLLAENQIMDGASEDALERFWDRLPTTTLNQCEQLLLNGMGKAILNSGIDDISLTPEEHLKLAVLMMQTTEKMLHAAADRLCRWLALADENAIAYVHAVIPQLLCRMDGGIYDWDAMFL